MPSGKQLSFQHGEVSPTQQYRSNEAMYSSALSKLRNFYVLNEGGIANRPGLICEGEHAFQDDIPTSGGDPGITGKYIYDPIEKEYRLFEYYESTDDTDYYGIYVDGVLQSIPLIGSNFSGALPSQMRMIGLKTQVLFTPTLQDEGSLLAQFNPAYDFEAAALGLFGDKTHPAISPTVTGSYFGAAPFLPVAYLVTASFDDGTEREVCRFQSGTITNSTTAPSTWVYPHAGLQTTIIIDLLSAVAGAKFYTFYRGAGRDNVFYKLAGRVKYDGVATTITFNDFGADDPAIGPPEDLSLLGLNYLGQTLGGMETGMFYQQRLLGSYDTDIATNIKPGEIGASSIYAPDQLIAPIIFNNAGAFIFSIPITDNSPVVAQLAMERGIVFTEKGVYVLRGGTQGVLTPTTVNPGLISEEGCSRIVEPKMKGRRGYFLNFDHTKLMAIEFGIDGNLVVYEISGLSEHFLAVDVHTMEVTGGKEDTLYMCRRDGKVIRVTMTSEAAGYSLLETEGYIENIYVKRLQRDYVANVPQLEASPRLDPEYDALMCYVIRDGVRYTERLAYREDELKPGFIYADHSYTFGERLAQKPDGSYRRLAGQIDFYTSIVPDGCRINIQNGTTYAPGDPVVLAATEELEFLTGSMFSRLHIFYDDENGNEKFLRFVTTGTTTPPGGDFDFAYTGYFEEQVPSQLQDVETTNPTNKLALQTRWLPAFNQVVTLDLVYKELSVYADGQMISSPLNPNMADQTITSNDIPGDPTTLPDYYCWGVMGLPYTNDLETLDIEASDSRTLSDTHKILNSVGVAFYNTQKGFFGMPGRNLEELAERTEILENDTDMQDNPFTGQEIVPIPSEWTRPGRVRVVQVDALPMTIVALYPKGLAGE